MRTTRILMGMPITLEVTDLEGDRASLAIEKVFEYFRSVDERFSTYKESSEITKLNHALIKPDEWSDEMKEVMALAEQTKRETGGYFDIVAENGVTDPSGIVKGWAIAHAAELLEKLGSRNYFVDAGGDVALSGHSGSGQPWSVGIRNPFNTNAIVKVIRLEKGGVATSGSYERGHHIYNPKARDEKLDQVVSITVVGPNVYEADRFATAAFAMGVAGIQFIESRTGLEGYQIDSAGLATETSGFSRYVST